MLVLLTFFSFAAFAFSAVLPRKLAEWIMPFHEACLTLAPQGPHRASYQAVFCGASQVRLNLRGEYEKTGLFFLLTASGLHLVGLERLARFSVRKRRFATPLVVVTLGGFVVISGLAPVLIRAFFQFSLTRLQTAFSLGWTRTQILSVAGLMSLPFCLRRGDFFGLALGWTAALALGFSGASAPGQGGAERSVAFALSHLWLQARLYILLIPPLIPLAVPHPVSILAAAITFPFFVMAAFGATLIAFTFPVLRFVTDFFWVALDGGIERLAAVFPLGTEPLELPGWIIGGYIAALTAVSWWMEKP